MGSGSFKNVINTLCLKIMLTPSAGVVEYTDCISAEE